MLYLIRGLPGSGKSTLAKVIARDINSQDPGRCKHMEADMFFVNDKGVYVFDKDKISDAHEWCQERARLALRNDIDVIVSNTFTTLGEIKPYLDMAKDARVDVQIIECHGTFKSVHNVPEEVLARMRARWQPTMSFLTRVAQNNWTD